MAIANIPSLERITVSASRLTQGARNAVHTKQPHHPDKASAVAIQNIDLPQQQSRSFAMAADATTSADDYAPFQQLS